MSEHEGLARSRLRLAVGGAGALFFAIIATLATVHLAGDIWSVIAHADSMASLRTLLIAAAAIGIGATWVLVIAYLAYSGPRGVMLATVAALATLIIIRVAIAIVYDPGLEGEPGVYSSRAARLARGECCPWDEAISRPPGYWFLLAGAYVIGGKSALSGEVLNIIFAVGTGLIVMQLGRRLYSPGAGAVAMLLYALWPAGALMIAVRLPHTAYDLFFASAALVVIARPRGWRAGGLAGLILGASMYLRPTTLFLVPVFMLARLWGRDRWGGWLTDTVVPMALAFLLVMLPIMAWHQSTRGVIDISTSAYGGSSMYHGTNVQSGGTWSAQAEQELEAIAGEDAWARSEVGRELAMQRLREDPVGIIALALRKQYEFWGRESYGVRYGIRRELASRPYLPRSVLPSLSSGVFYAALMALAAAGMWLRRRETDALTMLVVVVAILLALMHGLVEVRDRYHAYLIPLLAPMAAMTVMSAIGRLAHRRADTS